MSSHYAKPENALRKAEDLVKVSKESAALKVLHTILLSKRYRTWQPTHEKIMFLYIQLAVNLRRNCKDALVQYRMICQQASAASLEKVVRFYLQVTEQKANEAAPSTSAAAIANANAALSSTLTTSTTDQPATNFEVDDFEEESPAEIIQLAWPSVSLTKLKPIESSQPSGTTTSSTASSVSSPSLSSTTPSSFATHSESRSRERAERVVVVPWIRYLWDSYRTCLDVLRNNRALETLYHDVARQAFDFCRRYRRAIEFRKLGELLRHHIGTITKFGHQSHSVDLHSAETQNRYLETRFEQLRIAAALELWQEAYRTIEDIHEGLSRQQQSAQQPGASLVKPITMRMYYEKLSQIFWASDNALFHAYSLHQFFQLSAQLQSQDPSSNILPAAERQTLASAVLLATLIIPSTDTDADELIGSKEANVRLAALLGFKRETPTRARLLASLLASTPSSSSSSSSSSSLPLVTEANEHTRAAYEALEEGYGPLTLYRALAPHLAAIESSPQLARYAAALKRLVLVRVLQQLSSVYKTIRISSFSELVPKFDADPIENRDKMERVIMSAINDNQLSLRIDHTSQLLVFTDATVEAPRLQDSIAHLFRNMSVLASYLEPIVAAASASNAASPTSSASASPDSSLVSTAEANKAIERQHVFSAIRRGEVAEHEAVFSRQSEIEKRKQEAEKNAEEKDRREIEQSQKASEERKLAEQKRMADESQRREEERVKRDKATAEMEMKRKIAEDMAKKLEQVSAPTKTIKKLKQLTEAVENMDAQQLVKASAEVLDASRREADRKKRDILRRGDYSIRAMRMEERDLLIRALEHQKLQDRDAFEADFQKFLEQDKVAHAKALRERERLQRMQSQRTIFMQHVRARREAVFKEEKVRQDARVTKAAIQRRREERRAEAEARARAEEEERRAAAERARQEEEEERKRKEEETKQKQKEEERLQKLKRDEIARKQREREEEIERREQEKRAAASTASSSSSAGKWVPSVRRTQQQPLQSTDRDRSMLRESEGRGLADRGEAGRERDLADFRRRAPDLDERDRADNDSEAADQVHREDQVEDGDSSRADRERDIRSDDRNSSQAAPHREQREFAPRGEQREAPIRDSFRERDFRDRDREFASNRPSSDRFFDRDRDNRRPIPSSYSSSSSSSSAAAANSSSDAAPPRRWVRGATTTQSQQPADNETPSSFSSSSSSSSSEPRRWTRNGGGVEPRRFGRADDDRDRPSRDNDASSQPPQQDDDGFEKVNYGRRSNNPPRR